MSLASGCKDKAWGYAHISANFIVHQHFNTVQRQCERDFIGYLGADRGLPDLVLPKFQVQIVNGITERERESVSESQE